MRRRTGLPTMLLPLLAVLTSLAACSLPLRGSEPPQLRSLSRAPEIAADAPRVDWQLLIEAPLAAAGLDTARIALTHGGSALGYYAGVAWIDRAPLLVHTRIIESFERSRRIVAVGRETLGLRADFLLKVELRDFQAEYADGIEGQVVPDVRTAINVKLVEMPRRTIVADRTFEATERAGGPDIEAIVAAFDTALARAIGEVVVWTLREGEASRRAARR